MYCRKCGKYIDGPEDMCEDCLHNDLVFGETKTPTPTTAPASGGANPRMLGFKPALISVITGALSYVFMIMAFVFITSYVAAIAGDAIIDGYAAYGDAYYVDIAEAAAPLLTLTWVFLVISLPLLVVGIVFGVRSLKIVTAAKKQGSPMAIAPLIMSICGIVAAGLSVIFGLIILGVVAVL